jgi:Sec-independent protein secretion pathway component TatC
MLVKIFGAIDFIIGLILMFGTGFLPHSILIFCGITLLIKSGIGLLKNFASWIDLSSGLIFILSIFFQIPLVICLIAGILLIQKGIFSFL